ncbi:MAG TPA: tyrosine-type recombinase/integrase [Planctomycetaceae bacterium]|nr:tyrosine-type recombinase/integrase [Planctomycetaceae bacterium]
MKVPNRQVSSITESAVVPGLIEKSDSATKRRFVEYFTANIRNANTREAYYRAVSRFCEWCESRGVDLESIEATLIAFYIEQLGERYSRPTVKQHLAAIRTLFDFLVTGGILRMNPASSVRGPRHVVVKGRTPVLQPVDARRLLDSIPEDTIGGLRDRALVMLMLYTFARIGAAVAVNVDDVYMNGRRWWVRLSEKNGRQHEMPLHHSAEEAVLAYMDAADLHGQKNMPLFRTLDRHRNLTENRMYRQDAFAMIRRRARQSGVGSAICNHTMRATGITAYMLNGGTLERAQFMAAHSSSRTTSLYNRANDSVTLDEVERILI